MVTIRAAAPADAAAIARVHVDAWRTTYRGIVPDDFLRDLSYQGREAIGMASMLVWVAARNPARHF